MTGSLPVVLAPDKFKGSLTAPEVVAALAAGIERAAPGTPVRSAPIADGGDGTVAAFLAAGWQPVPVSAVGPTGVPIDTVYAVHDATAVIELAAVVGAAQLPGGRLEPLRAGTYGLGMVVRHALEHGARTVVLGLGGSASTDGGAGMLQALGLRILDAGGADLPPGGAELARAVTVDRSGLHPALTGAAVLLASDVDHALLGNEGAAMVFGPQKGADPEQCAILEAALARWAAVVDPAAADLPGAGAAGGTGFGAMAVLGATARSGIELVLELIDFPERLRGAGLVVTGEGSFDEQTLHGKAPLGVAAAARAAGVPVIAVAGRCLLAPDRWRAAGFDGCHALAELEPDPARSVRDAAALLERIGAELITRYLTPA